MLLVDLDPLSSQQRHAFPCGHQLTQLLFAEWLSLKGDADIEIEGLGKTDS